MGIPTSKTGVGSAAPWVIRSSKRWRGVLADVPFIHYLPGIRVWCSEELPMASLRLWRFPAKHARRLQIADCRLQIAGVSAIYTTYSVRRSPAHPLTHSPIHLVSVSSFTDWS